MSVAMLAAEAPNRILVSRGPGETRTALMADDSLVAIVHRRDILLQPGAVHFARVGLPAPNMPAVFMEIAGSLPALLGGPSAKRGHTK